MELSKGTILELRMLHSAVGVSQDRLHRIVTEMTSQGEDPAELALLNMKLYEFWEEMDSLLEVIHEL